MNLKNWIIVGVLVLASFVTNLVISLQKSVPDNSEAVLELKTLSDKVKQNEADMWERLKQLARAQSESRRTEDSLRLLSNANQKALADNEKQLRELKLKMKVQATNYQDSGKHVINKNLPK